MIDTLPLRIQAKISPEPNSGCWLWTASLSHDGYAQSSIGRLHVYGHRLTYEALVGPVPEGLELDHLCRVRCCVNPDHLEPVSGRINRQRGVGVEVARLKAASRLLCKEGHQLSGDNVRANYVAGQRICRACDSAKTARYRARKRAQLSVTE